MDVPCEESLQFLQVAFERIRKGQQIDFSYKNRYFQRNAWHERSADSEVASFLNLSMQIRPLPYTSISV